MKKLWVQYQWKKIPLWILLLYLFFLVFILVLDFFGDNSQYFFKDLFLIPLIFPLTLLPVIIFAAEFWFRDKVKSLYSKTIQQLLKEEYRLVWENENSILPSDFKISIEKKGFVINITYPNTMCHNVIIEYLCHHKPFEKDQFNRYNDEFRQYASFLDIGKISQKFSSNYFRRMSSTDIESTINEFINVLIKHNFYPVEK